ncbi:MAG: hypothetical protein ABIQ12_15135, partial [Opitutaceae bacterium]
MNRPSAVAAREQDLVLGREMPALPAVAASRLTPAYAEPDDGTAPTGERPLGEESGSVVPAARAARANLFGAVARNRPIACGMLFRVLPCLLGLGLVSAWGRETTAMADAYGRADFV